MNLEHLIRNNPTLLSMSRMVMRFGYSVFPSLTVRFVYRLRLGRWPNLRNPKTFTEKIQWMRLHDTDSRKIRLADKYLVREWVSEKIGDKYLVPLLGVWDSFDEIDFSELPRQFALKANHGSGYNLIVSDKSELDLGVTRRLCNGWLKQNYGRENLEPQYSAIPPKLVAEEFLENGGHGLDDYKVHCFNGEPMFIQHMVGRSDKQVEMCFYDTNWKNMSFTHSRYPTYQKNVSAPNTLNELLEVSKVLADGFNYVRVDFYVLDDGTLKFGEMTFTPASGIMKWEPEGTDLKLGEMIQLNSDVGFMES